MAKRRVQRRKPRDTVSVVPIRYADPSRGIDVTVKTLRYFQAPQAKAPQAPVSQLLTFADIRRNTAVTMRQEAAVRRERAKLAPPKLRPPKPAVVAPTKATPYQPRALRCDSSDYQPKAKPGRDATDQPLA